jgi:flagellar basal body-associated protein FliL
VGRGGRALKALRVIAAAVVVALFFAAYALTTRWLIVSLSRYRLPGCMGCYGDSSRCYLIPPGQEDTVWLAVVVIAAVAFAATFILALLHPAEEEPRREERQEDNVGWGE